MLYKDGTKLILDTAADKKGEKPIITGPKGSIYRGFKSDILDLEKKLKDLPGPPPMITDFHQAVKERKKFALNEHNGFRSCTLINIAKIALRENRPLKFDSDKLQFIDDEKANAYLHAPARGKYGV